MIGIKTGLDITSMTKTKQDFSKLLVDLQNTANKNPIKINIGDTTAQINKINNSIKTMGGQATQTSNNFKSLGSSMGSLTGFYTRWLSVSSAVNLALGQTKTAIDFAFTMDEKVRNISMITGESRASVQAYTKDWNNLALVLQQTTGTVADSNEEWARAGASMSDLNELTSMTVKTSEIAGSAVADTTSQAIALKNAYSMTNKELGSTLDSVVKMDNVSSTSTDRLMRSLLVTSASAKQAKVPVDWLVASLTTVQSMSKQTSESVGKNFKNIFLNMTKLTSGKDQVGLNKAEDQLNAIGIAMRSNATTFKSGDKVLDELSTKWKSLNEVQQAQLATSLAGKENINTFDILMQNHTQTVKNLVAVQHSQGSVDLAYQEHLKSAKGALNELKATLEQLYMKLLNGNTLKTVLNDLTGIVKVIGFLLTDGKQLTVIWIALAVGIKNFALISKGIGECSAMLGLLRTNGISALGALMFNPVILSIVALVAVLATVTYSQYKHNEEVKKVEQSYIALAKAMKEMDGTAIKEQTTDVIKEQTELDKLAKQASNVTHVRGGNLDQNAQGRLDAYIKTLTDAGFHVDTVTNKIIDLGVAQSNINTSDNIKKIQDKNAKTVEEVSATQALIQQYQTLDGTENKSADQKKILSNLSNELVGKMEGLTTSVDANGNMTITNTGYLGKQVTALDLLKQQSTITANTQIDNAIKVAQVMQNGSIKTLESMKDELIGLQSLNSALSGTKAGKEGYFSAITAGNDMGIASLQKSIDDINALKASSQITAPTLLGDSAKSYKAESDAKDGNTKATKANTASQKALTNATKEATDAIKDQEIAIKSLNNAQKQLDNNMSKVEEHSVKYRKGIEDKIKLLEKEKSITEGFIAVNNANAKSLVNSANANAIAKARSGSGSGAGSNSDIRVNSGASAGQLNSKLEGALAGHGNDYINAGKQYGIDPAFLSAITMHETGNGTSAGLRNQNNVGGLMKTSDIQMTFPSIQAGINAMAKLLAGNMYIGAGISTPSGIQKVYCPVGADNDAGFNKDWLGGVTDFWKDFSGGKGNSSIMSATGESNIDSGADSLLSKVESQKDRLIDIQQEIDNLKIDKLNNSLSEKDDRITHYENYIKLAQSNMAEFEVGSAGYIKASNGQMEALTDKYIVIQQKIQLVNNSIKNGGFDERTVEMLKAQVVVLQASFIDVYNEISTLEKQSFADIFAENDKLLVKFQEDATKVENNISLLGTIDTKEKMEKELVLVNDRKVARLGELQAIIDETESLNVKLKTLDNTTTKGAIGIKAITDRLKVLYGNQVAVEITITTDEEAYNNIIQQIKDKAKEETDFVKTEQDKIGEAIKKRYEESERLAKEALAEKVALSDKEHKIVIDNLNDEKNAYADFYNVKLKELDRDNSSTEYDSTMNDLVKAKMTLQKEYDSLLMDDSLASKSRRAELKDELTTSQASIDKEQYNRNIELQKNNISDLSEAQSASIDKEIKESEDLNDKAKEASDTELKAIDTKYALLLKDENIYRESTKALVDNQYKTEEGNIIKLTDLMTDFTDKWGEGLSAVGDKIKTELLDNLAKAQAMLGVSSTTTKDERTGIRATDDMSAYIDGKSYSLDDLNNNPEKYQDIIANASTFYIKDGDGRTYNGKTGEIETLNEGGLEPNVSKDERIQIKAIDRMSAYVDGKIYSLNELNNNPDKYKDLFSNATIFYIKDANGALYNQKTGERKSFSEGGVVDYTGLANVHGTPNSSEVTFNAKQALGLYNFVKAIPTQTFSKPTFATPDFSSKSQESIVHLNVDNLINVNGNIDKDSLPTLKEISKSVLGDIRKELNKSGFYRKV